MRNFTKTSLKVFFGVLFACVSIVKLHAQCNAAFGYVINAPSVTFIAKDSTPLKSHEWFFGDGTSAWGGYTVGHAYSLPGQYTVTHFIFDSLTNCSDSSSQLIAVNFSPACQAYFDYYTGLDSQMANNYYFVANSSATGGNSAITTNLWTVNGTPVDSSGSFSYTFTPKGTYNVCLNITTLAGCASQICKDVTVYGTCNLTPSFTYTVDSSYPANVSFFPHPDTAGIEYQWRVNGLLLTANTPVVQYYQSGSFPVSLFMLDSLNMCYDSASGTVTVPVFRCDTVSVSFNSLAGAGDSSLVHFIAQSNDSLTAQNWTIQSLYDSSFDIHLYTNNPTYHFADTGRYQVCLNANTAFCGVLSYCNIIYIPGTHGGVAHPLTSYPNPASNIVGINVPLTASGTININVYSAAGTRVLSLQTQGAPGNNHIAIPVQQLNQGQYFIDIVAGKEKHSSVFQKF